MKLKNIIILTITFFICFACNNESFINNSIQSNSNPPEFFISFSDKQLEIVDKNCQMVDSGHYYQIISDYITEIKSNDWQGESKIVFNQEEAEGGSSDSFSTRSCNVHSFEPYYEIVGSHIITDSAGNRWRCHTTTWRFFCSECGKRGGSFTEHSLPHN